MQHSCLFYTIMTKKEPLRKFGLLGRDIDYSFSRKYFTDKFSRENLLNHRYVNFDLPSLTGFKELLEKEIFLCGLNVTIPYKKEVIPFLDKLSEESIAIGAVNTIKFDGSGKTIGHNTDYLGFLKALEENLTSSPKKAMVLGTGGASGAIAYALKKINCEVIFVSRTPAQNTLTYSELNQEIINSVSLIVNTTPLGTFPEVNRAPDLPYTMLNTQHLLFDLIYNPSETLLMKKAKERGAKVTNGYQMLVYQAEKSWELWNQ